ncbi:hypothetical protein K438DRAFT_1861228 [Mycena galopus ATCC 62051]|nr:hypothetical protein K438DRAFT_1861228 [Mycena galopus ATCC 62051]
MSVSKCFIIVPIGSLLGHRDGKRVNSDRFKFRRGLSSLSRAFPPSCRCTQSLSWLRKLSHRRRRPPRGKGKKVAQEYSEDKAKGNMVDAFPEVAFALIPSTVDKPITLLLVEGRW